jgi:hypothetical protein
MRGLNDYQFSQSKELSVGKQGTDGLFFFVSGKRDHHEDDASTYIIRKVWKRLRETHALRVVEKGILILSPLFSY